MDVYTCAVRSKTAVFAALLTATLGTACSLPSETTTEAAAAASKPLSDGEILQVLETLNTGEVRQARLAQRNAVRGEVRDAAEMIIEDHSRANQQVQQIAESRDFELEESPLSRGLEAQANEIRDDLAQLSGPEFDCTFLQDQVELHELALDTVNSDLLPEADSSEVREVLNETAPKLEQHSEAARQSIASLPGCSQPSRG